MVSFFKINILKKIITIIAALIITSLAHSQTLLSFCTFVNSQTQECVFDNTKFITSPDSTHARIFMMVRSAQTFGVSKFTYKIYAIDRFDKEVLINTIVQEVQPEWTNCWQPAVFVSPGKYMVKVYRDETNIITTRGFEFFNY
jgi:hypothetical protein